MIMLLSFVALKAYLGTLGQSVDTQLQYGAISNLILVRLALTEYWKVVYFLEMEVNDKSTRLRNLLLRSVLSIAFALRNERSHFRRQKQFHSEFCQAASNALKFSPSENPRGKSKKCWSLRRRKPEVITLKHESRILGQWSNPVCGFSMTCCAVGLMENWLGSSLNQIQGWTTVRESYSRALEQGPLAGSVQLFILVGKKGWSNSWTDAIFIGSNRISQSVKCNTMRVGECKVSQRVIAADQQHTSTIRSPLFSQTYFLFYWKAFKQLKSVLTGSLSGTLQREQVWSSSGISWQQQQLPD